MNKPLQLCSVATLSAMLALAGGCASAPASTQDRDSQKSVAQAPPASGKTVFSEEKIDAMLQDDFWGSGAVATVDDEGRLTYVMPTKIDNDGDLNDIEHEALNRTNGRYYYIDPATGRPVLAVGAWQQPGVFTPRRPTQRFPTSGPGNSRPRAVSPASEPRRSPVSRGTRSTRDDRN